MIVGRRPRLRSLNSCWDDIVVDSVCLMGRNPACNVVFNDPRISQLHARVLLEAQSKLRVVDISTNGVFVNGAKIGRGRSQDLAHGDILSLVIIPREVNGAWTHPDQTIANTFVAYRVDFDVKSVVEAQPNGALRANTSPQPLTVPNSQFQLAGFAGQAEDFHAAVEGAEAAAHRQSEVQKESAQRDVGEGSAPLGHQAEMHTPAKTVADVRQGPTPDTSAKVKDEVIARGDGNLPHEQGNAQSSLKTASVQSPGSRVSAMMEADPLARYLKDHRSKDFADGFTLGHLLGEGGFAKVYEGTHKVTLTKVAVKVIDVCKWKFYNRDGGGLRASQLQEEFELHSKVAHPNIVRLYTMYESPRFIHIIMEKVEEGDLFELLAKREAVGLPEEEARPMFKGILEAVAHMHEQGICHRDLKAENILICGKILKIADFGLAKFVGQGRNGGVTKCGTTMYMAPEVAKCGPGTEGYGTRSDIWGLGMILYLMLVCMHPFDDMSDSAMENQLANEVGNSRIMSKDIFDMDVCKTISALAKDLLRAMLVPDDKKRITAAQALQHLWITGGHEIKSLSRLCSAPPLKKSKH